MKAICASSGGLGYAKEIKMIASNCAKPLLLACPCCSKISFMFACVKLRWPAWAALHGGREAWLCPKWKQTGTQPGNRPWTKGWKCADDEVASLSVALIGSWGVLSRAQQLREFVAANFFCRYSQKNPAVSISGSLATDLPRLRWMLSAGSLATDLPRLRWMLSERLRTEFGNGSAARFHSGNVRRRPRTQLGPN
jgi:hypothetical protein